MSDNFQQTVDLRKKTEKQKPPAAPLEKIYEAGEEPKKDWQTISRPAPKKDYSRLWRALIFILAFLIVGFTAYGLFFKNPAVFNQAPKDQNWYAVKLVNGETFYGQIEDIKSDPVVMANVYYNYDQAKTGQKEVAETASLRLVKRGKETHGPDGTMDIVRVQVLIMERLKSDSKVLQAILEYEK